MKNSFWKDKPLQVKDTNDFTNIIDTYKITFNNKNLLDYKIISCDNLNKVLDFINKNYIKKIVYNMELFSFYCENSMILEFYPKNKKIVVGYIVGKIKTLNIKGKLVKSLEVNFLCLIEKLRNIGCSSCMISSITKECILKYKTSVAHYTIMKDINSPYYCKKNFYHIPIDINTLYSLDFFSPFVNTQDYKKRFNTFTTDSTLALKFFNGNVPENNLLNELYTKNKEYNAKTFDIFEDITLNEFKETFKNKAFNHFVVYDYSMEILAYVCMFKLHTSGYISGIFYKMFFKDKVLSPIETIIEYIYTNKIYDVVTFSDIFKENIKCIPGTGNLHYYLFNIKSKEILPYKNGLVTI